MNQQSYSTVIEMQFSNSYKLWSNFWDKRCNSGLARAKTRFFTTREKYSFSVLVNFSLRSFFKNNSFCLGEKTWESEYSTPIASLTERRSSRCVCACPK